MFKKSFFRKPVDVHILRQLDLWRLFNS